MAPQLDIRCPEEDWTGRSDPRERRKLQNRLNQRLYRQRRRPKEQQEQSTPTKLENSWEVAITENQRSGVDQVPEDRQAIITPSYSQPISPNATSIHSMSWPELQQLMSQYEARAHQDMIGSPRVDLLLTLIQFNVFRALISNTSMLGLTVEEWIEDEDAISPWNLKAYDNKQNFCPRSLRPTQIQRSVSHHPWIDLFPLPRMRDNLLRNSDSYDEWALCNDLVDFYEVPNEKTGLIVWNTPWDPAGWEVSEEFLTKWKWVVEGCDELFTSTNYWRKQRGEEALNFY